MKRTLAVLALAVNVEAAPLGPLSVYLVEPCRFVDTRTSGVPLRSQQARPFLFRDVSQGLSCPVPLDAAAVLINVTTVDATGPGHVVAWSGEGAPPPTSVNNFAPGLTEANEVTLRLGGLSANYDAAFLARVQDDGTVHLVVDVIGYLK